MAKRRKARKASKAKAAAGQRHVVGKHSYSGRQFECYGKKVRAGKSTKKVPRIFCGKLA